MKATIALCATCLLVLVCATTASASQLAYVGTHSELLGAGPCNYLTVSEQEGAVHSSSAVEVLSGDPGSTENDYEFLDDGAITEWGVGGYEEEQASIKLDLLERGFPIATEVIAESPRAERIYENTFDTGRNNVWHHAVEAGQGIGVTVRAGEAAENKKDDAAVACERVPVTPIGDDAFNVWQPSLIEFHQVAPTDKEVSGSFGVFANVEYDTPIITNMSTSEGAANKGLALGGQVITVTGEHLANARPPEYGKENLGVILENTNTMLKFTTPEANEREGIVEGSVKPKIATFGGDATLPAEDQTYTYTETDKVPSREPTVTPIIVSALTPTTVTLSTTVNIKELRIGVCSFEVEPVGGLTEEEEEEFDTDEICEPLPKPFSAAAQPVSVTYVGLRPGVTYHYGFVVSASWDGRSGKFESPFNTLTFTTPGGGAKELGGIVTSPIITPPTGSTSTSTSPIKAAPIIVLPAVALAGTASVTAGPTGVLPLKLSCPSGGSGCIGSIILKTLGAVNAAAAHQSKKAVLTLATGSFNLAAGKSATIKLHLSAAAHRLLKKSHSLRARVSILAHDASGARRTTVSTITIHAAKAKHH